VFAAGEFEDEVLEKEPELLPELELDMKKEHVD